MAAKVWKLHWLQMLQTFLTNWFIVCFVFFATAPDVWQPFILPIKACHTETESHTEFSKCGLWSRDWLLIFHPAHKEGSASRTITAAQASQRWMSPVAERELLEYNRRVLIINQQLGRRENSELWPKDNHKPLHNCPSWMDGELPFPADAHLCALLVHLFRPLSPVMTARRVSAADARAARRPPPHRPPPTDHPHPHCVIPGSEGPVQSSQRHLNSSISGCPCQGKIISSSFINNWVMKPTASWDRCPEVQQVLLMLTNTSVCFECLSSAVLLQLYFNNADLYLKSPD